MTDRFGDTNDSACIQCANERAPADVVDVLHEIRRGIVGGEFETESDNEVCMANQFVVLVGLFKVLSDNIRRIADALEKKEEK